ncbi:MAG TPA: YajQ family cyclic di-GMP-binding protein [Desulfomicrobiaceae bacterium]|jgi:uncharacterized protein YajQ (UPF0234 family)|nr:YajQ family cyclic di-GMP-binding protein [Desulfomicrobiaceae bacterium]
MPSFDIVNEIDFQEVDNAVNNTRKEIETRYDFRGSKTEITLNRKNNSIALLTEDEMKLKAVKQMLGVNLAKRKVDSRIVEYKDLEPTSGGMVKQAATLAEGIDKDTAKKIVKLIKADKSLKVQPAIQDNQVRVTGKKIDDLQAVISMLGDQDLGIPLQYVNMKR